MADTHGPVDRKRRRAKGGQPPKFDSETYKGRNAVEPSFNLLKQWRRLPTRYDKPAFVYRGELASADSAFAITRSRSAAACWYFIAAAGVE